MQDADEAAVSTLSVPSMNSELMSGGITVPKRRVGERDSPATDIPAGSTIEIAHGDDDEFSLLSSASSKSATSSVPITTATTTTTNNNLGLGAQVGPVGKSATQTGVGARSDSQAESGGGDKGQARSGSYGDTTETSDIPNIPVVPSTQQGHDETAIEPRGRLRQARQDLSEASKAEARRRFWDGVKPARVDSNQVLPIEGGTPGLSIVTLRAAMKLKRKANVIQAKSVMNRYILNPRAPHMQYWKNWMVVNIMFTVLVTPWRISFNVPAQAFGLTLAGIVNISYIVDTVLHFFTAIETESVLLTDRKEIARRYLTSWFLLDLLTCFPYTTVLRNVVPASMRVLAPMRGLRLLKLLKVVKVYTMHYEVSATSVT